MGKFLSAFVFFSVGLSGAIADDAKPERVTVDNFNRAESDMYFSRFVQQGGFGKLSHERKLAPIDKQTADGQ